jgi:cytochrome c-type biogenesis protein
VEVLPLSIGITAAFVAGVLSFLSPCVLPLVPSYLSFISGMSLDDMREGVGRKATFVHALLFVAGFSAVFVILGASASYLSVFAKQYEMWVARVGGVLIILFGLHLVGALRIASMLRERRVHLSDKPAGYLGTIAVGMAFAAGWTPCIGPVLGGIYALASSSDRFGSGVTLLSVYSAGLAVPFLVSAAALDRFLTTFQRFRRFLPVVERASGAVLIVLGLLLVSGSFTVLTAYLYRFTPDFLLDFEDWMLNRGT